MVIGTTLSRKYRSSRKRPSLHQIFQVSIGGGDQTEIRFLWPGTPNPVISLFLNKLQHLHLGRKGKFTDLVQKQGTSVGPFGKSRFALTAGPGKGAGS